MPIGQHLGDEHGREEGEQRCEPEIGQADGFGGHQRGQTQHELVEQPGADHARGGPGALAQLVDPEVHGADEAGPAAALALNRPPRLG